MGKAKPLSCLTGKIGADSVDLWLNASDVQISIRGDVCAEVTVTQTFANHLDAEVLYGARVHELS